MHDFLLNNQLVGTIILAEEGINGTICGKHHNMVKFYHFIQEDERLSDIWFKETKADFAPFAKAKVKLRKEIVTLGVEGITPLDAVGEYVAAHEWNQLIQDPDVLLIDTRNQYEIGLGTFKHAINPETNNFREFPEFVERFLLDKKDKKIAMCCTGGVRCEKSTALLKKMGFENVYHLEGGILNYLQTIPESESLWEGTCFVFDDRIAVEDV